MFKILNRINDSLFNGFKVTVTTFISGKSPFNSRCYSATASPIRGGINPCLPPENGVEKRPKIEPHELYLNEKEKLSKNFCNIIVKTLFKVKNLPNNNFLNLPEQHLQEYISKG